MLMIWLLKTNFCMNFRPIFNRCSLMTVDKKKSLKRIHTFIFGTFSPKSSILLFRQERYDANVQLFMWPIYRLYSPGIWVSHVFFYETLECRKYLRLNSSAIWRKRGILMTLNRNPKTCRSNKEHWVKLNNLVWRRHPGQRYQTLW